jgi:hypothetical protein
MLSCFPQFATEIVACIFDEINDAGDCFSLALTSRRCWLIGRSRMKAFILEHAMSWAGDRIVCVGNYLDYADIPEGILTTEELEELRALNEASDNNDDDGYGLTSLCDKELREDDFDPHSLVRSFLRGYHDRIPQWGHKKLGSLIHLRYRKPDVLRNISKRQYVRRAALLEMRQTCPKHWEFKHVDLGHLVFSRFCWSTDPYVYMRYRGPICRGVWAGDRFDITSADALDERDENGQQIEWVDVTEEALEEMRHIWSSEFGMRKRWVQNSNCRPLMKLTFVRHLVIYIGH